MGNTAKYQKDYLSAINWYQKAIDHSISNLVKLQAKVNKLNILIEQKQNQEVTALIPKIEQLFKQLPPSRNTIYSRISFVQALLKTDSHSSLIINQLVAAIQEARQLGDKRAESHALGSLGNLYEQSQRWQEAKELTQQALLIAQVIKASELSYQWQWQLGRILKLQEKMNLDKKRL